MKIGLINSGSINSFWQNSLQKSKGIDLLVFGFNGLGLVSYKKELNGETEYFSDVARLSKQTSKVVISGCDTDTYGVFRHSAVIADNGRLLGVTDAVHAIDDSEFVSGGSIRVYDTSCGKIGLIIGDDLFFPEVARILSLCDSDFNVCLTKKTESMMSQVVLRANSFCNGVASCLISDNYACVSDIKGGIILAGSKKELYTELTIEKDYRLISSRRRGVYKEFNSGY